MITPIQYFVFTKALFLFFTIVEDAWCFPPDQPFPYTIDLRLSSISSERCAIEKGVHPNTLPTRDVKGVHLPNHSHLFRLYQDPFNYASDKLKITTHKIIRLPSSRNPLI